MTKTLDELYTQALRATSLKPRRSKSYGGSVSSSVPHPLRSQATGSRPSANKRYYLVLGFHSQTMSDIVSGTLHGVRGISSCKDIIPLWLSIGREAAIVMDAAAARKLNRLTDIAYGDPEVLLADGMEILHRLYDKKMTPSGGQQVMLHLVGAMKNGFASVPGLVQRVDKNEVRYFDGNTFRDQSSDLSYGYQTYLNDGGTPLSGVASIAAWLHQNAPLIIKGWNPRQGLKIMTVADWKHLVRYAARSMGSQYEDECEVLVSGDSFHVPRGSYLYVTPGGYEEKREALVEKWLPSLLTHYSKVLIIKPGEMARARSAGLIHHKSYEKRKASGLV